MTTLEPVTPGRFHEVNGVDDWRVIVGAGAVADFHTGTPRPGAALVDAIVAIGDAAGHSPEVDLRPTSVTVRLSTHGLGELSERDVVLAREISSLGKFPRPPASSPSGPTPPPPSGSRSPSTRSTSPP